MRSTFYSVSSLKQQSAGRPGTPLGHIILIPRQPFIALSPYRCMLSGEASNTNFIVFGFTWSRLKPTIYHTWDEHTYPRSTTLETSTLTHDLPHSRRAHLPTIYHTRDEHTYPQSTTLETSTLTHDLPHLRQAHLPTIYHTRDEHTYHYTTDVVLFVLKFETTSSHFQLL